MEHFSWCFKLGEGGCGRQGCATIEIWSFSSSVCMLGCFPSLQKVSCCVVLILVWFKSLLCVCFCLFWKC